MKFTLPVFLIFIFMYLQYSLWLGKNNLLDFFKNQQVITKLRNENDDLRHRNDRLFAETSDLYEGMEAIEERARTSLGMIKPEEHFYRLISEPEKR